MPLSHTHNIRSVIIQHIEESKHSIQAAVAWFNDNHIFESLIHALRRNISVEIILTNDSTITNKILDWNLLGNLGGRVYVYSDVNSTMHHKFCIIDDIILLTGSYNWTLKAHRTNKEDLLVFIPTDYFDISKYKDRFKELIDNSYLLTKNNSQNLHRDNIITYSVKNFMIDNCYVAVSRQIKMSLSGNFFITFITNKEEKHAILISSDASKDLKNNQLIEKDFFKPFIVIIEQSDYTKPIITLSLKEEWSHYNRTDS